ncbi:uncharacterized protein V1518DRAFT_417938 [Limtongia smithiae]|uniref:uncharacterized protein n=1 Tax=Limtongia smithiae TaxID=1125753 RepID=UPI0034CD1E8C
MPPPQVPPTGGVHSTDGVLQPDFGAYIDFSDLQLDLSSFDYDFDPQQFQQPQLSQQQQQQQQQQRHQQQSQHVVQDVNDQQMNPAPPLHDMSVSPLQSPGTLSTVSGIPPTPASLDFVSGAQSSASVAAIFRSPSGVVDPYSVREEMMFTPLLSPAVTPLDHPLGGPVHKDFVYNPSTYFSPLTSPALEAEQYPFNNGAVNSPDLGPSSSSKLRRRIPASYSASSSPAQGPSAARSFMAADAAAPHRSTKRRATAAFATAAAASNMTQIGSGDISSSESISPEPLLSLPETSMAPPPVPVSKTSAAATQQPNRKFAPVTPASLMNLSKDRVSSTGAVPTRDAADAIIEDVARRQSASATMMHTSTANVSLSSTATASANNSPALRPAPSPAQRPLKPVRSRTGSVNISPSLKPKISPSLKPLLPDGLEAASAALLASKSNYQNIVEGKHSQLGLSYPEQLSINLTSKRTSHKIAEQGRRNRINNALTELNQLLVDNINLPASEDEDSEKNELPQQCSKANTVELAIDYIKKLQDRIGRLKGRLKDAEAELKEQKLKNSATAAFASPTEAP